MTQNPNIKYTKSLVTLIDILGFRAIVGNPTPPQDIYDIIRKLQKITRNNTSIRYTTKVVAFSDTTIRIVNPVEEDFRSGALFAELQNLIYLQAELYLNGVICRGGMTYGDIYYDSNEDIYFGPAMIKAYDLESLEAIYPRIIIDSDLINGISSYRELLSDHHSYPDEMNYIMECLIKDEDGKTYINYIEGIQSEMDSNEDYCKYLQNSALIIRERLDRYKSNERVWEKYIWLAKYHNSIIVQYDENLMLEHGYAKSSLLVEINKPSKE